MKLAVAFALFTSILIRAEPAPPAPVSCDVLVYGGTPAAITAAIEAKRLGMNVVLACPDTHLGGMTSGGLGWTDAKDGNAVGGLAREFYHRIWQHYNDPAAWKQPDRATYAAHVHAQPGPAVDDAKQVMWTFEPHVAEDVFNAWMKEAQVEVDRNEWLDRKSGVEKMDHGIRQIRMLSGRTFAAKVFIDATYEGDLMAAAGITYRLGRDTAAEFNEPVNGIFFRKPGDTYYGDNLFLGIDPYVVPGNAASGFLTGIDGELPPGEQVGDADKRLQSFNYRLCLTAIPENRVPIEKPANYRESDFELMLRLYAAGHPSGFSTSAMPNGKTDSNNSGPISLDYIGGSSSTQGGWSYSDADYDQRKQIIQAHRDYDQGLLWTVMNSPRVPAKERAQWSKYGLAADEFTDTGHWPFQLYVREARRMMGVLVMTQHHVQRQPGYEIAESIGLGDYSLDSHGVRRVFYDGQIREEGGFYIGGVRPYPIGLGIIEPKRDEATNLLDPVTVSATHVAFGSLRMEPTYMILGQSAGALAALAVKAGSAVQDVPYADLRRQLLSEGQILDVSSAPKK